MLEAARDRECQIFHTFLKFVQKTSGPFHSLLLAGGVRAFIATYAENEATSIASIARLIKFSKFTYQL